MRILAGNFHCRWVSLSATHLAEVGPLGCTLYANEEQTENYSLYEFNVYTR